MLIVPTLMPYELHLGYMGRLMHLNSIHAYDIPQALSEIKKRGNLSFDLWGTGTTLNLLTEVTKKTETELVRNHTLIPIFTLGSIEDWNGQLSRSMRATAMQLVRSELCFCESCAADDLKKHGFSYWRREHQLPGNDWCQNHNRKLRHVTTKKAYFQSPSHFGFSENNDDKPKTNEARAPVIDRFLSLQKLLFKAKRGPSGDVLWSIIRQMAVHKKSYSSSNDRHLGHEMLEAYGKDWLQALSTSFIDKTRDWLLWLEESDPFDRRWITEDLVLLLMAAFLFDDDQLLCKLLTEASYKADINCFGPHQKPEFESELVNLLIRSTDDPGLDFVQRKLKKPKGFGHVPVHFSVLASLKQMSLAF